MEYLREGKRNEVADVRSDKRANLQDRHRQLPDLIVTDIYSEADMRKHAKLLTQKASISSDLLVSIKNGLLCDQRNVGAFLSVEAALPSLLRLISLNNIDARQQLLATHCLCNLALGEEKFCIRLAKAAGSYLVIRMAAMSSLLVEASVWAAGNLSRYRKVVAILKNQGAYNQTRKLLSTTADDPLRSACVYCLTHALFSASDVFQNDEMLTFAESALAVTSADSSLIFLISLTSSASAVAELLVQKNAHLDALARLDQAVNIDSAMDESLLFSLIRILGNLASESSGAVATQLLQSPDLAGACTKLLACSQSSLQKETSWFLANLVNHPLTDVKALAISVGVLLWFPTNMQFLMK